VEVRGVDLQPDPPLGVVAGDIAAPGAWQEAAAGCRVVVHTAAVVSNAVGRSEQWRVNVLGTRRVADAARGARLVHLSSVRAFADRGFPDGVTEDHPVRPDGSPYVDTKIASEQVVLQAHAAGEVEACVVRPGDVYGPGSRPWTILPVELIRRRRFLLPARGRGVHSPVYVGNLLDGIELAASREEARGQVFTITDGEGVTTRTFFGHYYRMLGMRGPPCLPTPVAVALAAANAAVDRRSEANPESMRYLARTGTYSIAKARERLGYAPRVGLEEGMARTEAWLRAAGLTSS
jgi:nucleoside-diphosphate-sugar epimerase